MSAEPSDRIKGLGSRLAHSTNCAYRDGEDYCDCSRNPKPKPDELTRLRAEVESLRASYRDKEPCGHPKNFLIGDDYGNFTCTVCENESLRKQIAEQPDTRRLERRLASSERAFESLLKEKVSEVNAQIAADLVSERELRTFAQEACERLSQDVQKLVDAARAIEPYCQCPIQALNQALAEALKPFEEKRG